MPNPRYCQKCHGPHREAFVYCVPCERAGNVAVFLRAVIIHGALQLYCGTCGRFTCQTRVDFSDPQALAYPEGLPSEDVCCIEVRG